MQQKKEKNLGSILGGVALFLGMLAVLVLATIRLGGGSRQQGVDATYNAIQRASVLCYATEGYYPPSLDYIEENYGVQIDYSRYMVRYDVWASNIMPDIRVSSL